MLQAGRLRVRLPITSLDSSIDLILPAVVYSWGFTQSLTEINARNIPGGVGVERGRRVTLTNSLSSMNQLSTQCGILDVSKRYGPPRPLTWIT
jgi:hypothetical protein